MAAAAGGTPLNFLLPEPSDTSLRNAKWFLEIVPALRNARALNSQTEREDKVEELLGDKIAWSEDLAENAGQVVRRKDPVTKVIVYDKASLANYAVYKLMSVLLRKISSLVSIFPKNAGYIPTGTDPLLDIVVYQAGSNYTITPDYLYDQAPSLKVMHKFYLELKDTDESMQGGKRRKQKRRSTKKHSRAKKSRKFSRKH